MAGYDDAFLTTRLRKILPVGRGTSQQAVSVNEVNGCPDGMELVSELRRVWPAGFHLDMRESYPPFGRCPRDPIKLARGNVDSNGDYPRFLRDAASRGVLTLRRGGLTGAAKD